MMQSSWTPSLAHTELRAQFPSLAQHVNGQPAAFFDGPGGTQTPLGVIEAMSGYLSRDNSNIGGAFATSQRTVEMVAGARLDMVGMLNAAAPEEIVFGQNMTSLVFALSHALARTWEPGDEIIVTSLDHDANVAPWLLAARDAGATVRTWEVHVEDCTLRLADLEALLNERTRLVAFTHGSNAVGTIPDVRGAIGFVRAKAPQALVSIDAVHYAPHGKIDVQGLDCDFLACSAYKFCGPHLGILYGKLEHLERLEAYKVRASSNKPPGKWETGTQSFESIAGLRASVAYLTQMSMNGGGVRSALDVIKMYERGLSLRFLEGAGSVPGLRVYGITDPERVDERTPTFGVTLEGWSPRQLAEQLGGEGMFVWDGHFYALTIVDRLGLSDTGGLVRIGFAHYNSPEEVSRLLEALTRLAKHRLA